MHIKPVIHAILKALLKIFEMLDYILQYILKNINRKVIKHDYVSLYFIFGAILSFVVAFTLRYNTKIVFLINSFVSIASLIMLIYVFVHIMKKSSKDKSKYFKNLRNWSVATLYFTIFGSIFFIKDCPDYVVLIVRTLAVIELLLSLYFYIRFFYLKYITTYMRFFTIFLLAPIITYLFWEFVISLFSDLFNINLFTKNDLATWAVLVLTILLINISVRFAPYDKIIEVKVAIYLILALSSAVSYCFFISDYITTALMKINEISNLTTYDQLKEEIDYLIRWGCLPYLIGSVFGCFSIELADRNYKLKEQKNQVLSTTNKSTLGV